MNNTWIIIVSYNALPWIQKCLDSCGGNNIVVVDNKSTDGTIDFIKAHFSRVRLLLQEKNLGFGAANNIGISYALSEGADYVFLLNQDAYLHKNTISVLIKLHKKNEDFGLLSPIHLNGDGTLLDAKFSNYLNYSANQFFYSDFVLGRRKKEVYEVPFINAAGWLLSRKCLETVGGFDPIFFHYGEDDNYCQRVKFHHFKVGVAPESQLRHDRVYREEMSEERGSTAYFKKLALTLKVYYSNINEDRVKFLELSFINRRRSRLKSYLKLNFKAAEFYKKEIKMYEEVIPQIIQSRKLNRQKGPNYLEVKENNNKFF